ncbi:hypothetical protein [Tomitella fengzijianii]|uniref:Uncharacterized protein n=1 Tax=Tomitella fengzijianii TaxID=2597660 RepID=A0A516X5Y5_9ACTN|nr:hypothetical protein [Tomitella fengzijianii]QDQ98433.1 hypothetical protein FO059_15295 [Tomitella fengzijianii]
MGEGDGEFAGGFSWQRERRWIIWSIVLVIAMVMIAIPAAEAVESSNSTADAASTSPNASNGLLLMGGCVLFVLAIPFLASGIHWRSVGWKTLQRNMMQNNADHKNGWAEAGRLHLDISRRRALRPVDPTPLVPRPGEHFHLRTRIGYSRYVTSGDGSYSHTVAFGTGPAGLALVGASLIGNSRRRSEAMAAATPAWREKQYTDVLAGNYGLVIFPYGRAMHFDWNHVTTFHPNPTNWTVTFEFFDAEPLSLYGPAAPLICVYAASKLWGGEQFHADPRLRSIAASSLAEAARKALGQH